MEPVTAYLIAFTTVTAFLFLSIPAAYAVSERFNSVHGVIIGWIFMYLTLMGLVSASKDFFLDSKSVVVTECKERTITELTWKK